MNKSELIDEMAKCAGFTKVDAKKAVDAFMTVTTNALKTDKNVTIPGFLTLKMVHRPEMDRRNVRTGATIKAPAKNVVKIKAGKTLAEAMN
jgi:DNA-binding protein HU-beta